LDIVCGRRKKGKRDEKGEGGKGKGEMKVDKRKGET